MQEKVNVTKCLNRTKGAEDDFSNMRKYGGLRNALLDSEGVSNIHQKSAAMKHVDNFLENLDEADENANETLKYVDINASLSGKIASYFVSQVHLNMTSGKEIIAPSTAVSYLSALKNEIADKFNDTHPEIPNFCKDHWGKFLNSVVKIKFRCCPKMGIPMVTPRKMATEKEREGISKLCIWDGSGTLATYLAVDLTLFHIVGHSCKATGLLKSWLSLGTESCVSDWYPVLKVNVTRIKVQMESSGIRTYPHRSNIYFDLHFALVYSIIKNRSQNANSKNNFPYFALRTNIENDEPSKKNSRSVRLLCRKTDQIGKAIW